MSDVFISYARSTAREAGQIEEALRALGFEVWRDDELPAHRAYAEVIEERLKSARAVVVVWSAEAARSQWVRAEAYLARQARTLVQLSIDGAVPPLPFNQIQCADLRGWKGGADFPGWRKVVESVNELVRGATRSAAPGASHAAPVASSRRPSRVSRRVAAAAATTVLAAIAVFLAWGPLRKAPAPLSAMRSVAILPIRNLTGDPSLDSVADTLTEDAIDLVGRSGLIMVAPSQTIFALKAKPIDEQLLGRQLHIRHVVTASLRKSAPGYRVTRQIVDTTSGQVVDARDLGSAASDVSLAERQLALKLFGAITEVVRGRWVAAELARPPDDRDPDNILARLQRFDDAIRRQDVGKAQALIAAGRSAIPRDSPMRAQFDMAGCE
jgi:adenylate cyclase